MASEQFSLCWDNFHKNMSSGMNSLLESEDLVDVTIAVEGKFLKAHKMVLSVCSPYFKDLFKGMNPYQHPVIFMKDVSYVAISDLLQFMYQGEVQVSQENLTTFIKTAEALQIKGLTGDGNGSLENENEKSQTKNNNSTEPHITQMPRPKVQRPAPGPVVTSTPVAKKPRLSQSSEPAATLLPTKQEPVAPVQQEATAPPVHFKMEPYDQNQSVTIPDDDDQDTEQGFDDTHDDTEDYSMMEGDEQQAGTSADGAGEGQDQNYDDLSILMQLGDQFKRQSMVASYDVEACLNQSPPKRKLRKGAKRTPMVFLGEGTSSQGAEQTSLENYGSEPSNSPFDNTFYIKDESEYETPIFNLDDEEECFDRTKSSLINFDIKNIIEQDLLLNAIRNKSLKREPLTNFEREKISDFLVKHFMNELGKLNNDDFTYLAKKIEEYFPGEKRLTYFVPPVPKSKSSTNVSQTAKGKLPDKQRNITSVINKIKSRGRKQKTDDKALKDTKALSIPQSARDSLTWLKQNLPQSLDEVKQHWNNSYPIRKTLRENDGNIETFLENWPILKLDDYIKELVNFDFKKIFGWKNEDSVKDINFNVFFNGILQARKYCLSITDNTTLDVLKSSELTSDSRIAIQLHLLPSLVPPKGRMYVGTGQWKPSIQECRDGLLIHVKDPEDIEAAKAQQARFLLSKNQPVLPYILLVGNSLSNISQAFVVFNNKEYICASVFQALDFCFKLHHVFGAKYSFSCAHIWYLIQWKLYNIHTKSDKKITFINDLI